VSLRRPPGRAVFTGAKRPAGLAAAHREVAVSRWDAKNIRPSPCVEVQSASQRSVGDSYRRLTPTA
jgi:hypothetical protein